MDDFRKGAMPLDEFQSRVEGILNMMIIENGKDHEGIARKFVNELEVIQFTLRPSNQREAALSVAREIEAYIGTI